LLIVFAASQQLLGDTTVVKDFLSNSKYEDYDMTCCTVWYRVNSSQVEVDRETRKMTRYCAMYRSFIFYIVSGLGLRSISQSRKNHRQVLIS